MKPSHRGTAAPCATSEESHSHHLLDGCSTQAHALVFLEINELSSNGTATFHSAVLIPHCYYHSYVANICSLPGTASATSVCLPLCACCNKRHR